MASTGVRESSGVLPDDLSARDRILETAERLFAERGFDRTSTARIAAAASVPHGLIFYHFKTKMELLLAVVRDREAIVLEELLPPPRPGADLRQAVAEIWQHLSAALGRPSIVRRIIFQELAAHPEVRQRALELHDQISAVVSQHLAQANGHEGQPSPEYLAAARLLTIAAGMAPLLGEPGQARLDTEAVAAVISGGLRPGAC
ncbi:MAG TPA: helix-turn-helix domain-containing protein [Streptosporangiaceae bacterium]